MPPSRIGKKNQSAATNNSLLSYWSHGTAIRVNKLEDSGTLAGPSVNLASPTTTITQVEPATGPATSETEPTKLLRKGERDAKFLDDRHDWDGRYHLKVGTSTRKITLGSGFALTNKHIDQLLALGPRVCGSLTDFIFNYTDVSYDARDSASSLTGEAVIRLAEACPKLKKVQLQGANGLTEAVLTAFFRYCADLTSLEITKSTSTSPGFTGAALEALRLEPERLPKLKKLILPQSAEKNLKFMTAMRSLTKARPGLTVQLVSMLERKQWGDFVLEKISDTYKKGRKQGGF
ncbi:MAG: hypothetical protein Q9170_001975 [Blastenia crenularia]